MDYWVKYDFEARIRGILSSIVYKSNPDHHFGRPFLSAYQIAIEYNNNVIAMGFVIGGKGVDTNKSLSRYMGSELSKNIKNGIINNIEGCFFSNLDLKDIIFDYNNNEIVLSAIGGIYDCKRQIGHIFNQCSLYVIMFLVRNLTVFWY